MSRYFLAIGLILFLLLGWIVVQQAYRRFARRHPELGPFRNEDAGCGSCSGGHCGTHCDSPPSPGEYRGR